MRLQWIHPAYGRQSMAWLLVALMLSACSHAAPSPDDSLASQGTGETLLAQPPNDWQVIYRLNTGTTRLIDYLPASETEADWQNRVSFEAHQALVHLDPIDVLVNEAAKRREQCRAIRDFNLFSGYENGYATSTRLFICDQSAYSQQGEVSMLKVIQGKEYLYIVRLQKRIEPFIDAEPAMANEEIAAWSSYLGNIRVCDPRSTEHACPPKTDSPPPQDQPSPES